MRSVLTLALQVSMLLGIGMSALDPTKLAQKLSAGADILGTFKNSSEPMSRWMSTVADSRPLTNLNVPGTHDAAAWNYTGQDNQWFNTQDKPLFGQLDAGVRLIDLRFGWNGNKLAFYHSTALLSNNAELDDVFWGLYAWLEAHPTETVFVSLKVDNGPTNLELQNAVRDLYSGSPGSDYWYQKPSPLPTLGDARKKLILFRRFVLDANVPHFGYDFSHDWADNNRNFSIQYHETDVAWIEDLYELPSPNEVEIKFNATASQIQRANNDKSNQLYITFASGSGMRPQSGVTPKVLALGNNGSEGINSKLLRFLHSQNGGKIGIVLVDFYGSEPGLIAAIAGTGDGSMSPPSRSHSGSPLLAPAWRFVQILAIALFSSLTTSL